MNTKPDQVSTAAAGFLGPPRLVVGRAGQACLVGDEVHLHSVDLPDLAARDEPTGRSNFRVEPISQSQNELEVLLLGLAGQSLEVLGADTGRLFGQHMTTRV